MFVAIDVQQALRVADSEVLKVQKTVRVVFPHELDKPSEMAVRLAQFTSDAQCAS